MRLNYSDDEDFPGQFGLWQANCRRSMQGKRGQAALRRLEAALLSMPTKRLIREAISDIDPAHARLDVCSLGAVAMMEGHKKILHGDDDPQEAGEAMGFPSLVAWAVVAQNDIELEWQYERQYGPVQFDWQTYMSMDLRRVEITPEDRYDAMLAWVRSQLR